MTKQHKLVFLEADRANFDAIKSGKKKLETRAAVSKYRQIKAGDGITFICGRSKFKKRVVRAAVFKTITAMLKKYKVVEINPQVRTAKELQQMYLSYPRYPEKLKQYGLIVWELE
ncbi:MAG: hypothetical protein V1707_03675 [bacterium]